MAGRLRYLPRPTPGSPSPAGYTMWLAAIIDRAGRRGRGPRRRQKDPAQPGLFDSTDIMARSIVSRAVNCSLLTSATGILSSAYARRTPLPLQPRTLEEPIAGARHSPMYHNRRRIRVPTPAPRRGPPSAPLPAPAPPDQDVGPANPKTAGRSPVCACSLHFRSFSCAPPAVPRAANRGVLGRAICIRRQLPLIDLKAFPPSEARGRRAYRFISRTYVAQFGAAAPDKDGLHSRRRLSLLCKRLSCLRGAFAWGTAARPVPVEKVPGAPRHFPCSPEAATLMLMPGPIKYVSSRGNDGGTTCGIFYTVRWDIAEREAPLDSTGCADNI